jgi:hypothetical protein
MHKLICKECGWRGQESEMLLAPNPFDPEDQVCGCPGCKAVDSLLVACDELGCWQESTCGTPTPEGYRRTCGRHMPDRSRNGR